jgi:predicted PurR-regulated permease PerM
MNNTATRPPKWEEYYMRRLERLSFLLSIGALLSMFVFPVLAPCLLASMAIVFAVLSKGGNLRFSRLARLAVILGVIALVINVLFLCYSFVTMKAVLSDPEGRQQLSNILYRRYGMTLDELLSQIPWLE